VSVLPAKDTSVGDPARTVLEFEPQGIEPNDLNNVPKSVYSSRCHLILGVLLSSFIFLILS
jgi:hypothetical protein